MSDDLQLTIREGASGKLAILNGKTYTLLRLYRHRRLGGVFCLAVAGLTGLKAHDLDDHWRVIRSGDVYLALKCRPFSYHLIQGRGAQTDVSRWPRLKAPPNYYAFVGPSEEAIKTQIRLTLDRYHSSINPEDAIELALRAPDVCGGPPAYLLRAKKL
jgi:hypothetical protein